MWVWHIDPVKDGNANAGIEESPLRSLAHLAKLVNSGDTVLVHADVYFVHMKLKVDATTDALNIKPDSAAAQTIMP